MIMYFENVNSLDELKREYHKKAMELHPDRGGSKKEFQELQNQYEKAFQRVKNYRQKKDGSYYFKEGTKETANDFMHIMEQILTIKGVKIEVIGCFVWITGVRKEDKTKIELLKSLKFRYSKDKNKWYWHTPDYVKKNGKKYDMKDIRTMFGVQYKAETESEKQLAFS